MTHAMPRVLALASALVLSGCPAGGPGTDLPPGDVPGIDLPDVPAPDAPPADPGPFPAEPPPGFLDPVPPALTGSFLGRLNAYEALGGTDLSYAKGVFTVHGGDGVVDLPEGPSIFEYTVPVAPGIPEDQRGQRYVVLQSYATSADATFARARYALAQVMLPASALQSLAGAAGDVREVAGVRGWVRDLDSVLRPDRALVQRDCWRAVHDPAAPARVWVDARHNDAFTLGENVLVWVNLSLVTEPAALKPLLSGAVEDVDGAWCTCSLQGEPLPCADFEDEAGRRGVALSCAVPEDLGPGDGPSHAVFRFKGPLLPPAADAPVSGVYEYDVEVDGTPLPIDYAVHATRSTLVSGAWAGKGLVSVGAIGGLAEVEPGRFRYHYVDTQVMVDALAALKADGQVAMQRDGRHVFLATAYAVEQVYETAVSSRIRVCPLAVLDVAGGAGTLWACTAGNEAFAVGETLELAGTLRLTSDPAALAETFGNPPACICQLDGVDEPCDAFPAAGGAP